MFADIIIDISHEQLDKTFQYNIPDELRDIVKIGSLVNIPFGRANKMIQGYVINMGEEAKYPVEKIKYIDSLVTDKVGLAGEMIELAYWIKKNYGSTMNQALKTVIPVKDKVSQKEKKSVCLNVPVDEAKAMLDIFLKKNAKAKFRLVEALIEEEIIDMSIIRSKLNISASTIKSLEDDEIIKINSEEYYRNPVPRRNMFGKNVELNPEQRQAADLIKKDIDENVYRTYLLHGITGSGKTEVYLDVIEKVIESGKQVIMLIPEIALTLQTVQRFYYRFGDKVSILNSKMSKGERYDQFLRSMRGEISVIIGPRSALFTPFPNLGLIVIDEEHEGAYKSDKTPRYHARPVAIHIAKKKQIPVILGSATPSVDSYERALNGEYKLITLTKRAGDAKLPKVYVEDMRDELRAGNRSVFSRRLKALISDRLEKKEQIMLFLNKRGYAGFISCRSCGHVMKCPHCDVSLTAHNNGKLICHYCGYEQENVTTCPECGSKYIAGFRAGTQALEKLLKKEYPNARVLRMDTDTTKNKGGHERILECFANHEADILVGTQMIVKGHDFPDVTLVGIVAADMSLYASDYKAPEKTFQLLTQSAGRAGRGKSLGEVVIQSYTPDHYSIQTAAHQDFRGFFDQEISYRKLLGYPPILNMLKVTLSSPNEEALDRASISLKERADKVNNSIVLGPTKANIYKINDIFSKVIYIRNKEYGKLSSVYENLDNFVIGNPLFKNVLVNYDFNE